MLAGGLFIGGLWLVYLAGRSTFTADEKNSSPDWAARWPRVFGVVYLLRRLWAASVQPQAVKAWPGRPIPGYALYRFAGFAGYGWLALVVVAVLLGAYRRIRQNRRRLARLGWRSGSPCWSRSLFTVYRDGVRDLTLLSKGYDVWDRVVVTNWSVVGLFLVLFVAGLGVVGWLVSVVARAKKAYGGRGLTAA